MNRRKFIQRLGFAGGALGVLPQVLLGEENPKNKISAPIYEPDLAASFDINDIKPVSITEHLFLKIQEYFPKDDLTLGAITLRSDKFVDTYYKQIFSHGKPLVNCMMLIQSDKEWCEPYNEIPQYADWWLIAIPSLAVTLGHWKVETSVHGSDWLTNVHTGEKAMYPPIKL